MNKEVMRLRGDRRIAVLTDNCSLVGDFFDEAFSFSFPNVEIEPRCHPEVPEE
jgi:hypothetical protein